MATLLKEAPDNWCFDKLIQPLSNAENQQELIKYLSGKHSSSQHNHIDPIALSRILLAIKFVSSKKKLSNTLKPFIDEVLHLCHSILSTLRQQNELDDSSPWLWVETILAFIGHSHDANHPHSNVANFPHLKVVSTSQKMHDALRFHSKEHCKHGRKLHDLPQFLFPEWSFTTKRGVQLFADNFKHVVTAQTQHESDSDDDDDDEDDDLFGDKSVRKHTKNDKNKGETAEQSKPKSRTLCNVKFLSFPRPNPPQTSSSSTARSDKSSLMMEAMRKRQKTSASSYTAIGGNETDRKRKISAINDKLSKMINKKNEKKNSIRFLSIHQKRQMREDSDRKERERRYQIEQKRLEKERLKRLEKEKQEREEKEKQLLQMNENMQLSQNNDDDEFGDFDAFMNQMEDDNEKPADVENTSNKEQDVTICTVPPLTTTDNEVPSMVPATDVSVATTVDTEANKNVNINVMQNSNIIKKNVAPTSSSDDESIADLLVVAGSERPKKETKPTTSSLSSATVKTETPTQQVVKESVNDPEEQRLSAMGIPKHLQRYKWLYENCGELTQENREKIVKYLTGKYSKTDVQHEDILLNRRVMETQGVIKDSVFRMLFKTKSWKKIVLTRKNK